MNVQHVIQSLARNARQVFILHGRFIYLLF